jgi:uncharacterized phage protein gp47/JayE
VAILDDSDEFLPLFPEETEQTIRERWAACANEGLTEEDVDEWVDVREGSFWYVATAPAIREAARIYDLMGSEFPAAAFPLWTWGEYLDDLALGFDLERNAASFAAGVVKFTSEDGVAIPAGTQVAVEGGPEYQTTEGGAILPGGGDVELPVKALLAGSEGNVGIGAITLLESPFDESITIANEEAIVGGSEAETDEALRERLLAAHEGKGPGNKKDYAIWALAYGEGVGRAIVVPLWKGPGTVLVIVLTAEGDPVSAETVEGLQNFLDPVAGEGEGEAPIGPTVTVTTAEQVKVDVEAEVELETGYSLDGAGGTIALEEALESAIADEINRSQPGDEVVRQKIVGRIVSLAGVHDVGEVKLNTKSENVVLDDDPAQVGVLDELKLTEADV